jgi:cobalt-zinc-cadmium efflux system outer membrane protein
MLTQPLELGGKRAARISAAERGRDVAQAQLAARRADVRGQTHDAWREVLAAQEGQRLAEDATKLAQRATRAAAGVCRRVALRRWKRRGRDSRS